MVRILHLETATKVCSVALSENGELVSLKEVCEEGYSHGEKLTLLIGEAMDEADWEFKDLNAVSVTAGPGSYTGLRIGASTAKGICYAMDIPLIAIDSLISLAAIAKEKHGDINLCPMIDARRMEVYNSIYDQDLNRIKPISADILDESTYSEFDPFVFFGDGAEKADEHWKSRPSYLDSSIQSSAKGHIQLSIDKYRTRDFEDVAYWEPFYLKDFVVGKKST